MSEIQDHNIIEVGYTFKNKDNERTFKRNVYINYNQLSQFIKNSNIIDAYCTAYLYDSKEIDKANLYGSLYLDFDDSKNLNNAREDAIHTLSYFKIVYKIMPEQIKIFFSGHKGFHLIIPKEILGIKPCKNLNEIFKSIAEQVNNFSIHKTVDLSIYDNRRLFRIPNTIHGETNLYKIMLTPKELLSLSEQEIMNLAKQPRYLNININRDFNPIAGNQYLQAVKTYEDNLKNSNKRNKGFRYRKKLNIVPECIKTILENGAEQGTRNITIACLTSFYKESGKTFDEIIDIISEWNSRNQKPTPEREMKTTIKSIFYSEKTYGCTTLQTLVRCNKSECKLIKENKKSYKKGIPHAIKV